MYGSYCSWQNEKRPFTIIYMNPVHADDFTSAGWHVTKQGPSWVQF